MRRAILISAEQAAALPEGCAKPQGKRFIVDRDSACYRDSFPKSRGLGDTIAKVTSAVGIKPCSKCKERQQALNKLVPYS